MQQSNGNAWRGRLSARQPRFFRRQAGEGPASGSGTRKIVRVMSGWLRDSQAHIVFWFGISLVFGMTRRIVRVIVPGRWLPGKQFQGTSFFLVFSCCIPAAWDNNPNNCSLCCLGCCWGFGIRGSGFGVSGSGIGIYVYIPLFIYILSIIFSFFLDFFGKNKPNKLGFYGIICL